MSIGSVWRVLDEQGLRRKKSLHASERDTERVRALRRQHVKAVAGRADVHRFYFLDETGLRLDYCRRYARAVGNRRAVGAVPLKRLTLIGALGVRGLKAVQVLDRALNQRSFAFYVAVPQLRGQHVDQQQSCAGPRLRCAPDGFQPVHSQYLNSNNYFV